jgi:hypothetical protein
MEIKDSILLNKIDSIFENFFKTDQNILDDINSSPRGWHYLTHGTVSES